MLSDQQRIRFDDYCAKNPVVFSNRIVTSYFQNDSHILLLLQLLDGNDTARQKIETSFRKHFFQIRFIHYIGSTIKFSAIDHLRRYQKINLRQPLIFDQPLKEDSAASLGEALSGANPPAAKPIANAEQFQLSFTNEHLAHAFSKLSTKQQDILTYRYAMSYQDKEIAEMLGTSQQAVSKTRNLALKKLRLLLVENHEGGREGK